MMELTSLLGTRARTITQAAFGNFSKNCQKKTMIKTNELSSPLVDNIHRNSLTSKVNKEKSCVSRNSSRNFNDVIELLTLLVLLVAIQVYLIVFYESHTAFRHIVIRNHSRCSLKSEVTNNQLNGATGSRWGQFSCAGNSSTDSAHLSHKIS